VESNTPDDVEAAFRRLDEKSVEPAPDETVVIRTGAAASAVSAKPPITQLTLMIVGAAGILAGMAVVFALSWAHGESPVQTAVAAAPATNPVTKTASPVVVDPSSAPTWIGSRTATRAYDGTKTISFELAAAHDVSVWMSRARPVLVTRCLSRMTEVFIILGTSSAIEQDSFKRTVRVQWDDGPEVVQQWQASESAQELFAPDGAAFLGRLAHASRLRVGFTPFNAQPVTVEFVVQGFDQLAGLVAGTCGWKL